MKSNEETTKLYPCMPFDLWPIDVLTLKIDMCQRKFGACCGFFAIDSNLRRSENTTRDFYVIHQLMICFPSAVSSIADHPPLCCSSEDTPCSCSHLPAWTPADPASRSVLSWSTRASGRSWLNKPQLQPTARLRPPTHYRCHRSAARTAAGGGYSCGLRREAAPDLTTHRPQPQRGQCRTRARRQTQPCGSERRAARRPAAARGWWLRVGRVRSCPRRRPGLTSCSPCPAGGPQLSCSCACLA